MSSTLSDDRNMNCKICDGVSLEPGKKLYKPCECDHSVHKHCLIAMVRSRIVNTGKDDFKCSVCQAELKYSFNENFETQVDFQNYCDEQTKSQNIHNRAWDMTALELKKLYQLLYLASLVVPYVLICLIVMGNNYDDKNRIQEIIIFFSMFLMFIGPMSYIIIKAQQLQATNLTIDLSQFIEYSRYWFFLIIQLFSSAQILGLCFLNLINHGDMQYNRAINPMTWLVGMGILLVGGCVTCLIDWVIRQKLFQKNKKIIIKSIVTETMVGHEIEMNPIIGSEPTEIMVSDYESGHELITV